MPDVAKMATTSDGTTVNVPVRYQGVNHIALVTNDMDKTVRFYRDLLGMKLVGTTGNQEDYPYRHYFLSTNGGPTLAFFEWPGVELPAAKASGEPASGRAFDHLAIGVSSLEDLETIQARLRQAGWPVGDIVKRMGATSLYFEDPNNISLEMTFWPRDLDRDPLYEDDNPVPSARETTTD